MFFVLPQHKCQKGFKVKKKSKSSAVFNACQQQQEDKMCSFMMHT